MKLLNDTLESAVKIQAESQKRQESEPGTEVRTELGILHFRTAST